MAIRMRDAMFQRLDELRYEPVERRVRALSATTTVVDSSRPLFVWEPRRVVPSFAVPIEDVRGELVPAPAADEPEAGPPVLHPGIAFAVHSADGREPVAARRRRHARERGLRAGRPRAGRPRGPRLQGLRRAGWRRTSRCVGHARDPYHRIDMRRTSRPVRIERDGELLAQSTRAVLLWETSLPTRFYVPREDVVAEARPGDKRTTAPTRATPPTCPSTSARTSPGPMRTRCPRRRR